MTLRRVDTGELLYMGSIFDDASDISITRHFENYQPVVKADAAHKSDEPASSIEARRNRRLLYWVMRTEGFANYSNEWWHFDYGNQMWIQNRDALKPGDPSPDPYEATNHEAFYGAI